MSIAANSAEHFSELVRSVRACTICKGLPLGPNPIFQIGQSAKILIAGQAPGRITHAKNIPFDDPSGKRLREWLGVDRDTFYDSGKIAIVPMGFCFPGSKKGGDLPPRPECAEAWREPVLAQLENIELTLVIGRYALDWHLDGSQANTLTETVKNWRSFWPDRLPLPHPSPRNMMWIRKNPWFATDILPRLRERVADLLAG